MRKRQLKDLSSNPYYLFAPDYIDSSSGIVAMHLLCHALNVMGEEAYMSQYSFDWQEPFSEIKKSVKNSPEISVNKHLRTPILKLEDIERHKSIRKTPIAIYPEIVTGNPWSLKCVARYVLNVPGFLGGDTHFDENELQFVYRKAFSRAGVNCNQLYLPTCDLSIFNLENTSDLDRSGCYFYINKYRGNIPLQSTTNKLTEISFRYKRTLTELAEIFKSAELLYSYEPSALCLEALLCGCPVVYLPNKLLTKELAFGHLGNAGIAWGDSLEQIEHAKATVKDVYPTYLKLEQEFWIQLDNFIDKTQVKSKEKTSVLVRRLHDKAVILHLSSSQSWEEFSQALLLFPDGFDLYVSTTKNQFSNVSAVILMDYPNARFFQVSDKGSDFFPFLIVFKEIEPLNYHLILKLHDLNRSGKLDPVKSNDLTATCYQIALNSLVQSTERVNNVFNLFKSDVTLGVLAPSGQLNQLGSSDVDFHAASQLIPGVGESIFDKNNCVYTDGTIFWFRPEAIKNILKLTADKFEELAERFNETLDGTSRVLFSIVCQASGYSLSDRVVKKEDIEYLNWLNAKRENALSRDMSTLSSCSYLPVIHCLVYVNNDGVAGLANTIDSIGAQDYGNWHLSVISSLDCPDEMFNSVSNLSWLQIDKVIDLQSLLLELGVQSEWTGFLEAGDYLEPHALSACVEYCNNNPEWKLLYTDEDRISSDGYFHSAKFKPDFNLDFFYSTNYIGGLALFNTEVLNKLRCINFLMPIICYELILNYLDLFGKPCVGHVEHVLLHRPDYIDELTLSQTEIRKYFLSDYFKRVDTCAAIGKGLLPGSFYIQYPLQQETLVSIIISIQNELDYIRQCLDSIFEKTSYQNYEVILVDQQNDDSELLSYLADINKEHPQLKIIAYTRTTNYAAVNNFAVEQASGNAILLLNNDTVVLQEDWLQGMLSELQREGVAAVGGRMLSPDKRIEQAGFILGMGKDGVVDSAHYGLPMNNPGYMGRALVKQELSALSSACLMITKESYEALSGMNESLTNIRYSDVDFCLRLREKFGDILWVPNVSLIYHGLRYRKKPQQDTKVAAREEHEAEAMHSRWLSRLAHDPAYNRNLSLKTTGFQLDRSLNMLWNADFKQKPKVYAFPPDSAGVGEYRVRGPVNTLARAGLIEGAFANNVNELILPTPVEIERIKPDVLFMQNGFLDFILTAWKRYRKFNDVFMVCGQDDIVYMLPESHPMKGEWPTNLRRKVKEQFQCSDRLIVANEALAKEFETMADDIVVVPNYLENIRWDSLLLPENNRSKKLRVGWAGGHQHVSDLQFILPIVEALHKEVDWVFMGLCLEELEPFVKEIHKGVTFDLYPQKLAELNLDLAIAPLMHNKFNECKTNLRLLEYGVLGWPVVCSDVLPYQNAPVTRVANNTQHWIKTIRGKINEPDALVLEGEILKKWVLDNYMLDDHVDEWFAALMP